MRPQKTGKCVKMTENTGKYMKMQEVEATYSGKYPGTLYVMSLADGREKK
jgi:hypothetical protein